VITLSADFKFALLQVHQHTIINFGGINKQFRKIFDHFYSFIFNLTPVISL
jgi:hypothetical protein